MGGKERTKGFLSWVCRSLFKFLRVTHLTHRNQPSTEMCACLPADRIHSYPALLHYDSVWHHLQVKDDIAAVLGISRVKVFSLLLTLVNTVVRAKLSFPRFSIPCCLFRLRSLAVSSWALSTCPLLFRLVLVLCPGLLSRCLGSLFQVQAPRLPFSGLPGCCPIGSANLPALRDEEIMFTSLPLILCRRFSPVRSEGLELILFGSMQTSVLEFPNCASLGGTGKKDMR